MSNSLDPKGLIWVQTVCQSYQQTTLVDKELGIFFIFFFFGLRILQPKFLHFRKKNKILFLTFFTFSDVKKLPDLKKIFLNIQKKITKIE